MIVYRLRGIFETCYFNIISFVRLSLVAEIINGFKNNCFFLYFETFNLKGFFLHWISY